MPNEFRFLLICSGASHRLEDGLVNLMGVVNNIQVNPRDTTELAAIVGLILTPEKKGKRLDLMAWQLGKNGERLRIPEFAGIPLILPEGLGPRVLPYSVTMPIRSKGIFGFELFDREGVFGPKESLLATYMFGVHLE